MEDRVISITESKRLLVIEHFSGGHYTNYLATLIPELVKLVEAKVVGHVVVSTTRQLFSHMEATGLVDLSGTSFKWDPSLPVRKPNWKDARRVASDLLTTIDAHSPDFLVCTSADRSTLGLAFSRSKATERFRNLASVGAFHRGLGKVSSPTISERCLDYIYRWSWRRSPWRRLLFVNPLVYESLVDTKEIPLERIGTLADPVPAKLDIDQQTARAKLGLPLEGRLVGFIGQMDRRKAIPELLNAWSKAIRSPNDRLVLVGRLDTDYRQVIESKYAGMRENGNLIVIDRYLSDMDLRIGYAALDIVAVVQYRRSSLSENVLKAIASGKLTVVDNHGYTGMIANRFGIGYSCDVTSCAELVSVLEKALNECKSFILDDRTKRLLAYHDAKNFAGTIFDALSPLLSNAYGQQLYSWEWVNQA